MRRQTPSGQWPSNFMMKTINRIAEYSTSERWDAPGWADECEVDDRWVTEWKPTSKQKRTHLTEFLNDFITSLDIIQNDKSSALEHLSARVAQVERRLAFFQNLGIEKTPGICGGSARIVRTRIPVWTLESFRRLGVSEWQILESYPSLNASDLIIAWAYVASNQSEIDEEIRKNNQD